jgi:hypothetical protein
MVIKITKKVSISFAVAILIVVIMQSACRKEKEEYISQEDFINTLKGEWHVQHIDWGTTGHLSFMEDENKLCFGSQYFKYNDPNLRNVPNVKMMQNWTITENNKELFLEAKDLLGGIFHYKVDYSNYQYQQSWGSVIKDVITWDMSFVSQDTTITFNEIQLLTKGSPPHMFFYADFEDTIKNYYFYEIYQGHIEF